MNLDSIRVKAPALLVASGLLPVLVAVLLLLRVNAEAVRTAEKNLQVAVLAEIGAGLVSAVRQSESDATAVSAAITEAASAPAPAGDDGLRVVRAILATRSTIDAARFEVPTAAIDTIVRSEHGADAPPPSTPELRRLADERGAAFTVVAPGRGAVVVPVAPARDGGARGYVTVGVDLGAFGVALRDIAERRFGGARVGLVVLDADARVVAAEGTKLRPGDLLADRGMLAALPAGVPWTTRVAVVGERTEAGELVVGAADTVPELGWVVAMWRPEPVAYSALAAMKRTGLAVALGTAVLTLLVGVFVGRSMTAPIVAIAAQARLIGQRRWSEVRVGARGGDELGVLARSLQASAADLERSEVEIARQRKLGGDLGRFLDPDLVQAIVEGRHAIALGGRRENVTVLFADVVAFTPLAETHSPETVVAILNELFSLLSEIVFRHGGTVDKFIGDCLMAVWGAPVPRADHASRALAAADDMLRFLESANDRWRASYGVEIRLGIGVNSGDALVGNIGSEKRMEYTVIGDVVNVAARLEAIAAPNQVLVGEGTHALVGDEWPLRFVGARKLTGREKESSIYELET